METTEKETFIVDLYIRVSTDRQATEGDSLEEQESELKKFCEYRKFQIHHIFIERGKSGGNTNRPEYQKLIKDVKAQKINAVVVKKLDRLSRSLLDFEQLMTLFRENNVEFISLKESFDTTSAMGKAMLRVALVFAQLEREQTSERLVDVLEYRASQGLYNGGTRPFGYTNVNKELIPYPKEKEIIKLIFTKFLETKSTTQTAKFLNDIGSRNRNGKLWDKRQLQKLLQSPVYLGKVKWKFKLYQGIHQPIISEKIFDLVQVIFKNNHHFKGHSKTLALLQSIIFCSYCLSPMTPSHGTSKTKLKYYYYRCTSTQNSEKNNHKKNNCSIRYLPLKKIDHQICELLLSLSEEQQFIPLENQILKYNQGIETELNRFKDSIQLAGNQLTHLKAKKDQYLDSLISSQFTSAQKTKITNRLDEMEIEEKQLQAKLYKSQFELTQKQDEKINLTAFKMQLITFKTDFEQFSPQQLRATILTLIEKISYSPQILTIQFKSLPWPQEFSI